MTKFITDAELKDISADDILIVLISDKNPLFNESTLRAVLQWAKLKKYKYIHIVPTGTLQRHSEIMDKVLSGYTFDQSKVYESVVNKERQNTNRALLASLAELKEERKSSGKDAKQSAINVSRWKPQMDAKTTPKFVLRTSQKCIAILEELKKLKINESFLNLKNGFYETDVDLIISRAMMHKPDEYDRKKIDIQITYLKQSQSMIVREIANKLLHEHTHTKPLASYLQDRQREFKAHPEVDVNIEVTPWEAIAGQFNPENRHPDYEKCVIWFLELIKHETIKKTFDQLVDTVLMERLNYFFKNSPNKAESIKHYAVEARPYIQKYLAEEIPYFQMLINTAITKYESNGKKGAIHLAYPMESPVGKHVFEYVFELNLEILEVTYKDVFKFVDTTSIMKVVDDANKRLKVSMLGKHGEHKDQKESFSAWHITRRQSMTQSKVTQDRTTAIALADGQEVKSTTAHIVHSLFNISSSAAKKRNPTVVRRKSSPP